MNRVWRSFRATWGRRKRHGITGNFSTVVILTGIVMGGWVMTGGEYPRIYPTYTSTPIQANPIPNQPIHQKLGTITFRQLLFTQVPTPTPRVNSCEGSAIVFLVDVSTSMKERAVPGGATKLDYTKSAILAFSERLAPEAILGLYTFSSPNANEPSEHIPPVPYSSARTLLLPSLQSMNPPDNAATHMRAGFEYIVDTLTQAKQLNREHDFNLVFISDGVPEQEGAPGGPGCVDEYTLTGVCDRSGANNSRNFDIRHDPTGAFGNPDIPGEIKAAGIKIYSIAIANSTDQQVFPELKTLMQNISSGPGYYFESVGGSDLDAIYQQVKSTACP